MNCKVLIFLVTALVFNFKAQASTMNCLIEKHYVFTSSGKPFERGELNKNAPTFSKGSVGKMFNVNLEKGLVNNVLADVDIIKNEGKRIYQLRKRSNNAQVIELLNLADDAVMPEEKMTFILTVGLEVASGYCQKQ